MLKALKSANVAVYRLEAPSDEVEFLVFGKPKDIEGLISVLAPSFEEDLVVERLDAERVPGYDGGYEGVLPENEGPAPLCLRAGDPITYLDADGVRRQGTYLDMDGDEYRYALVRDAEADDDDDIERVHLVTISLAYKHA